MRPRDKAIKVTVCIDRIAASGGYMIACVADKIVAAPFAIIGSIGVVAQVPNVHRLLKKHDVDFQETAGEFKRTVSVFGEITAPAMNIWSPVPRRATSTRSPSRERVPCASGWAAWLRARSSACLFRAA
jgi:ClpP class serine protease